MSNLRGGTDASLASIIESVRNSEANPRSEHPTFRISILRNYTVEAILPLLKFHCFRNGVTPVITVGDYDNVQQEILNTSSHVYETKPDLIIVSLLLEHLDPASISVAWDSSAAQATVLSMLNDLVAKTSVPAIVNTFISPLHSEDGIGAARHSEHRVSKVHELNAAIRRFAREHADHVFVLDWERILMRLGEQLAIDYRFNYLYRAPFKKDFNEACAAEIGKIVRLLRGGVKKCLVLDCDNTLWGGVIGEDGLDGIALNPHEYPGRCYYEFQRSVLNLVEQGVLVALCSKNNADDVFEALDKHPHCLLKRSHLAAWRIDWNNKAANLTALAQELNLGIDSFVFVDDSAVECQLIRQTAAEVTVLQVPGNPYDLPRLLYSEGWFDTLSVSSEDRQRTSMYVAERERSEFKSRYVNVDEYLQSLELAASVYRARDEDLARVAQLVGKTNQFNLTTRRHPEVVIRDYAADPDWAVYVMKARDRFAELGVIATLIAHRTARIGTVDTLLMSCRALGRRLEEVFVDDCLSELETQWGIAEWRAEYVVTRKNGQVRDFWERMGFAVSAADERRVLYHATAAQRNRPQLSFVRRERP